MYPPNKKYIGAIDQGTTSTRFVIFDNNTRIISIAQLEHKQIYSKPGWVEHDPMEIRDKTYQVIKIALQSANIRSEELSSIGITNQRETTIIWNPRTGRPYYNAIVWQDTRTGDICNSLAIKGDYDCYRKTVGLPLSTYFSGPKIKWILDNVKGVRNASSKGDALFGNIDSWIIWWLTGGPGKGVHITDITNASRTMLMNIHSLKWDDKMLKAMDIPGELLPEIKPSSYVYGYTEERGLLKAKIPISGDLGDQQAALFGQACFNIGDAKNTYGTGSFMLLNTGKKIIQSKFGLITTVGYKIGNEDTVYALEGSVAIAGLLVQWARDNLGFIANSDEIETLARKVKDSGGIYFVPAFSGLFAPHWRSDARGIIIGLTHYINKSHLARSILESTAFQIREIFDAMEKDSGIKFNNLKVDGGMVVNELLMQFQSDILNLPVIRPKIKETSVLGAAYASGLAVGFWKNKDQLGRHWKKDKRWTPKMNKEERERLYCGWLKAVERSMGWLA